MRKALLLALSLNLLIALPLAAQTPPQPPGPRSATPPPQPPGPRSTTPQGSTQPLAPPVAKSQKPFFVVVIVNADEPLKSAIIRAVSERFAPIQEVELFIFRDKWPATEPSWSITIVANQVVGDPSSYVMATAITRPIGVMDYKNVANAIQAYDCVPKQVITALWAGRVNAVSDLKSMFVSSGKVEAVEAAGHEAVDVFRLQYLNEEIRVLREAEMKKKASKPAFPH